MWYCKCKVWDVWRKGTRARPEQNGRDRGRERPEKSGKERPRIQVEEKRRPTTDNRQQATTLLAASSLFCPIDGRDDNSNENDNQKPSFVTAAARVGLVYWLADGEGQDYFGPPP